MLSKSVENYMRVSVLEDSKTRTGQEQATPCSWIEKPIAIATWIHQSFPFKLSAIQIVYQNDKFLKMDKITSKIIWQNKCPRITKENWRKNRVRVLPSQK